MKFTQEKILELERIVREAGNVILEIANSKDYNIDQKKDGSFVTKADGAANEVLMTGLSQLDDTPIISEESDEVEYENEYWLIDPLDGTADFLKGSKNYCVMVAYMIDEKPVFGMIYAPAKDELFYGGLDIGSSYKKVDKEIIKLDIAGSSISSPLKVVASRSHRHPLTDEYLSDIEGPYDLLSIGSGLKFCYVATGDVDVYVRYQGTYEWDTAAGQAIAEGAGAVFSWQDSDNVYGKKPRLNRGFKCYNPNLNT